MAKKKKKCPVCGAEVNKENLDKHLQRVHGQVVEEEIEEKESTKPVGTRGKKKAPKEEKRGSRKRKPKKKSRENMVVPIIIFISFIIIVSLVGAAIYYNLNQNGESNEETTNNGNGGNGGNGGGGKPVAIMTTTLGTIRIELDTNNAPATAQNFINLASSGFYDGLIFHRVIQSFMIQGGGFTPDGNQKSAQEIPWENTGLKNQRYSISMARWGNQTSEADSGTATSQFFINTVDNSNLDSTYAYVVFGKVIEGFSVVDAIEALPTDTHNGMRDWPDDPPVITSVAIDY